MVSRFILIMKLIEVCFIKIIEFKPYFCVFEVIVWLASINRIKYRFPRFNYTKWYTQYNSYLNCDFLTWYINLASSLKSYLNAKRSGLPYKKISIVQNLSFIFPCWKLYHDWKNMFSESESEFYKVHDSILSSIALWCAW